MYNRRHVERQVTAASGSRSGADDLHPPGNPVRACRTKAVRHLTAAEVDPGDLPTNRDIRNHLQALDRAGPGERERLLRLREADPASGGSAAAGEDTVDRFRTYELLLLPLEHVVQPPEEHPEGDVLYHSLQVFELARQRLPYDEEFLTAALLHDVGKAIDWRDHVAAGLEALDGAVSPRTAWLIEHHVEALSWGESGRDRRTSPSATSSLGKLRRTDAVGPMRPPRPRRRSEDLRSKRGDRVSPQPVGGMRRV